jgi:hypothetical protein
MKSRGLSDLSVYLSATSKKACNCNQLNLAIGCLSVLSATDERQRSKKAFENNDFFLVGLVAPTGGRLTDKPPPHRRPEIGAIRKRPLWTRYLRTPYPCVGL